MIKKDSFAEYRKAEGINASLLKAATSPRAVQKYLERDSKPSDQMILGTLFHNLLLEPNAPDWIVAPEVDKRTKAGKEAFAEFEANANGKTIVTQSQLEIAEDMMASLDVDGWVLHPFAETETSCYSMGKKARFDAYMEPCDEFPTGVIWDIKTAKACDFRGFQRSCYDYSYDLQAWWYCHLFEMEFGLWPEFRFLAIETQSPHIWQEFIVDESFLASGKAKVEKAFDVLQRHAQGSRKGNESKEVQVLSAGAWW
jgi:exodeoxyribonuclease VIII